MSKPWLSRKRREELRRYLDDPLRVAATIGSVAEKLLGNVEVFLFGSTAEGDATMASDIDVLVVSPNTPKSASGRSRIAIAILEKIGLDAPVEIHVATPEELKWYKRFSKKMVQAYPGKSTGASSQPP